MIEEILTVSSLCPDVLAVVATLVAVELIMPLRCCEVAHLLLSPVHMSMHKSISMSLPKGRHTIILLGSVQAPWMYMILFSNGQTAE